MTIHPVAKATFLFAIVLAAGALLLWLAKRLRGGSAGTGYDTSDSLTNFRELHSQGGLSDEEFRTIKSKLAAELVADPDAASDDRPSVMKLQLQKEEETR